MRINKIIHQTWKTNQVPEPLIFCVDSWRKLNPGWEYILWTDEQMDAFVKKHFPDFYDTYVSYPANIFRADLFRLMVVYQMGGVYVDLDMECVKSLDHLFDTFVREDEVKLVLSCEPPQQALAMMKTRKLYQAIFLAGQPGSKALDAIIRHCVAKGADHALGGVLFATGPGAITECLKKILPDKSVKVLDYKVVNPFLDITNQRISVFFKRDSIKMLMTKEYYPETCMVHYWHHAYWACKPILAQTAQDLEHEYKKCTNFFYWLNDLRWRMLPRGLNMLLSNVKKSLK